MGSVEDMGAQDDAWGHEDVGATTWGRGGHGGCTWGREDGGAWVDMGAADVGVWGLMDMGREDMGACGRGGVRTRGA